MPSLPFPLLLLLGLVLPAVAHPASRDPGTITLPLSRRFVQPPFVASTGTPQPDHSLADTGFQHAPKYHASVTNQLIQVVTAVQTGDQQTFPNLVIDTGSALLWVGAGHTKYASGPYTVTTGKNFSQGYEAGGASGPVYLDRVTIGSAVVDSMFVGAGTDINGFTGLQNFDGLLGLGRNLSNSGTISGLGITPTFVDALVEQGEIAHRVVGIYLESVLGNMTEAAGGEMTFGGVNRARISGTVNYVPQTMDNFHWAVNVTSYSYGGVVIDSTTTEALVDTGTLPILLPFDAFFTLLNATNGTVIDSGPLGGWLAVSNATDLLQPLSLNIGGVEYAVPVERYLVPQEMYAYYNYSGSDLPTWIASGGFGNANLGQKFLELVYSVFDSDNERIGFAQLANDPLAPPS